MTSTLKAADGRRLVWVVAVITWTMVVVGVVLELTFAATHPGAVPSHRVVSFLYLALPTAAFAVTAVAIIRRHPSHPVGLSFAFLGVAVGAGLFANGYTAWPLPVRSWTVWLQTVLTGPALGVLAMALLLFPTGTTPSPRWRWMPWVIGLQIGLTVLLAAAAPWAATPYPNERYTSDNPIGIDGLPWLADAADIIAGLGALLILCSLVSLFTRFRASTGNERLQVKWMGLAGLVFGIEVGLGAVLALTGDESYELVDPGQPGPENVGAFLVGDGIFLLTLTMIPVAMALGIVRYRLYDIDRLISRTIVYGTLAVLIGFAYVGVVVLVGDAVVGGTGPPTLIGLMATAAVALTIHPLRLRLQSRVDRWIFGPRAEPYEVMAAFGRRLAQTVAPSDVLTRIAETAGAATGARAARASVSLPDGGVRSGVWGDPAGGSSVAAVGVEDTGEAIGEIVVHGGTEHPAGRATLERVAEVSTVAMRNLRLVAELEDLEETVQVQNREIAASRGRLIDAAEEERRHLQELVTDHLEPDLDAIDAEVAELRSIVGTDGQGGGERVDDLVSRATGIIEGIRSLSRGVLPSVLADHGLTAALVATSRRAEIRTTVDAETAVRDRRLPTDVEISIFLCCRAAIDDASATGAPDVSIRLRHMDTVSFLVTHHGPASVPTAVSDALRVAADRIVALGGEVEVSRGDGFRLFGSVPLAAQEASLRKVSTA